MAAAAHLTTLQQHLSSLVRVGGSAPAALARVCSSADLGFDPGLCACTITPSSVLCSLSCLFSALMQSLRCTPAKIKYSWLYFLQFRNLYVFSIKHCTPAAFLSSCFPQLNEGSLRMIFQFIMAGANILDIRVATRLGLAASPVCSAADAQSVWVPQA